eukprot:symbB.v1.2.003140.t1/scaffold177.1/size287523/5
MAVEVGKVAYLLLAESFDRPRWRQALVVKVDKEWIQVLVRAKQKREVLNHFTCLDYDGKTYFLVELLTHQLRAFYEEPCLDLMAEAENLVDAASQLLVSDSEIVFATASEPEPPALTSRPRRKKVERPPSPSNSSSGEGSDFTDVMEKLRKNWQGEATSGEKVRDQEKGSKHEKFPLLTKDKTKKEKDFMESFPRDLLSGLKQGGDPVQALLTPPACRKAGKSGSKEAQVPTQIKEQFKEFEPYGFRVRPKYVKEVEEELGTDGGKPYKLHDVGRRISWGKQKSLQKVHYLLSEILTLLLKKKNEEAALQVALSLRAVHQAALDQGD